MAKTQTRRSLSVKGTTYLRLRRFCHARGESMAGWLEALITRQLDRENAPLVTRAQFDAWASRKKDDPVDLLDKRERDAVIKADLDDAASGIFTF